MHLQRHTWLWIISVRYVSLWHLRTNLPALNHYHGDSLSEVFVWLPGGNLIWCLHQLQKAPGFQSPECPAGTSRPKISYPGRLLTGLMYEARIEGNGIACANPRCRQSLIKGEKVKPSL